MTFVRRKIDLTFQIGLGGQFGESGTDAVKLGGLRVAARIDHIPGPGMGQAEIRVYGLKPSLMNKLSALNKASTALRDNTVTLEAGDDFKGMATVFQGHMILGQQCLNAAPETHLLVLAQAGTVDKYKSVPPITAPGSMDAAVIMFNIAQTCGWLFENAGVSVQLSTPYFPGEPMEQIRACAAAGNFLFTLDKGSSDRQTTLVIWPKGGSRKGQIPVISSATGMIGYPNYSTSVYGLDVQTEFNPLLSVGGRVEIRSSLEVANGTWGVFGICHELESEVPNGPWFTRFNASALGGQ